LRPFQLLLPNSSRSSPLPNILLIYRLTASSHFKFQLDLASVLPARFTGQIAWGRKAVFNYSSIWNKNDPSDKAMKLFSDYLLNCHFQDTSIIGNIIKNNQ